MKRWLVLWWYKFKNRYTFFPKEPPAAEPRLFVCGSKEELVRLTRLACAISPQAFEFSPGLMITYEYFHGAGLFLCINNGFCPVKTDVRVLARLLSLILDNNKFEGTYRVSQEIDYGEVIVYQRGCNIAIEVYPPSAHERAESLLALSEWLDGKVSEEEKRELMQLLYDVEI